MYTEDDYLYVRKLYFGDKGNYQQYRLHQMRKDLPNFISEVRKLKTEEIKQDLYELMSYPECETRCPSRYGLTQSPSTPNTVCNTDYPSLSCLNPLEPNYVCKLAGVKARKKASAQKQEEDMNSYATAATINVSDNTEASQRRHLKDRAYSVYHELKTSLSRKFGLMPDDAPRSAKEIAQRILDGKYILPTDQKYDGGFWSIEWRDPSVKADQAGFDAAKKILKTEYTKVTDDIIIQSPTDGLTTLRAFEAFSAA